MTFQRWAAPLLAAATLVACADAPTETSAPPVTLQTLNAAVIQQQTRHVADGIARALGNPANRRALHAALQASNFSDHKTTLKRFVHSAHGVGVVNAAAAALNETREQFIKNVDALPPMDFYMPFRENRLTWRWSDEVVVAASFDGDAPQLTATDALGSPHILRLADGAPTTPLVIIHPAEPVVRIPAGTKGEYIEASTELDLRREHMKHYRPSGVMPSADCAPEALQCEGETGGGPPSSPPPPPPGLYITDFDSYRGDGWNGSEIEIQWHPMGFEGWPEWLGGSYWLIPEACYKDHFAEADLPTTGQWGIEILLSPGISNVNNVDCGNPFAVPRGYMIQIIEIDGGLNGENDDFGRGFFRPGTMPFGFTVGNFHDYYSGCGDPGPGGCGELSVLMRVQYRYF